MNLKALVILAYSLYYSTIYYFSMSKVGEFQVFRVLQIAEKSAVNSREQVPVLSG